MTASILFRVAGGMGHRFKYLPETEHNFCVFNADGAICTILPERVHVYGNLMPLDLSSVFVEWKCTFHL